MGGSGTCTLMGNFYQVSKMRLNKSKCLLEAEAAIACPARALPSQEEKEELCELINTEGFQVVWPHLDQGACVPQVFPTCLCLARLR